MDTSWLQELEECNHQMQHTFHDFIQSVQAHGVREQDAAAQISKGNSIIAQFAESMHSCRNKVKRKQAIILRQVFILQIKELVLAELVTWMCITNTVQCLFYGGVYRKYLSMYRTSEI